MKSNSPMTAKEYIEKKNREYNIAIAILIVTVILMFVMLAWVISDFDAKTSGGGTSSCSFPGCDSPGTHYDFDTGALVCSRHNS